MILEVCEKSGSIESFVNVKSREREVFPRQAGQVPPHLSTDVVAYR